MDDQNRAYLRLNRYSAWNKLFVERRFSFMPVIEFHLKRSLRKKLCKYLLFVCIVITLFFLVTIVFDQIKDSELAKTGSVSAMIDMLKEINFMAFGNTLFYNYIYSLLFIWFLLFVISSSEIISMDRKLNATVLYLTKPLSINDYIAGKMLSIVIFIFAAGFLPIVLMYIVKLIVSQDFSIIAGHFILLVKLLLFFSVYSLFISSIIMLISAIMKSSRMVIIVIFALYFISGIFSSIIGAVGKTTGIFPPEYAQLVSVNGLIQSLLKGLIKNEELILGMFSFFIMIGFSLLFLAVIRIIVKRSI